MKPCFFFGRQSYQKKKESEEQSMVVHTYNPSSQETEAEGLRIPDIARLCLKKPK
jgi:hypothetical protein